jgi:hypothetical protein
MSERAELGHGDAAVEEHEDAIESTDDTDEQAPEFPGVAAGWWSMPGGWMNDDW